VGLVGGGERAVEERIGVIEEGLGRAGGGMKAGLRCSRPLVSSSSAERRSIAAGTEGL